MMLYILIVPQIELLCQVYALNWTIQQCTVYFFFFFLCFVFSLKQKGEKLQQIEGWKIVNPLIYHSSSNLKQQHKKKSKLNIAFNIKQIVIGFLLNESSRLYHRTMKS